MVSCFFLHLCFTAILAVALRVSCLSLLVVLPLKGLHVYGIACDFQHKPFVLNISLYNTLTYDVYQTRALCIPLTQLDRTNAKHVEQLVQPSHLFSHS